MFRLDALVVFLYFTACVDVGFGDEGAAPTPPLVVLTQGTPPGYSGLLAFQDGKFSAPLSENVAVSEYLVKEKYGVVSFSIFLKDPARLSNESDPTVVEVDFNLDKKLRICIYSSITGVTASYCPITEKPIQLVSGSLVASTFEIRILDDGHVETRTEGQRPFTVPQFAKLGGRPITDTGKALAVQFRMTVINATTDVYLQLKPGQAATVDKNQNPPAPPAPDVPKENGSSTCKVANWLFICGLVLTLVHKLI